jgi:ABC-2 type transport system permease protein
VNTWANIRTITKRELGAYFSSPIAYVFIVIFLLLCGFFTFFFGHFFDIGQASLSGPFFMWHPWFYLFLVPAVGMRLWAEERRVGTIELLLTMPITAWQAIVGKFLASWLFLLLALVLTFPIVLTVIYLGSPSDPGLFKWFSASNADKGVIFCAYLGSWLMAGAYLAVSCITSAMTRTQVVSFIISVVLCLCLILVGVRDVITFMEETLHFGPRLVSFVASLSVLTHFDGFQKGVLDSRDLLFFLSLIAFSLFSTSVILRGHRAG